METKTGLLTYKHQGLLEAGCDEAGRGALAGPVFAAAVIWPAGLDVPGIRDSKKMSAAQRQEMRAIIETHAISFAVASVGVDIISQINILNASILAMHHAVEQLQPMPEFLLIDGNRFKEYAGIPHETIIKGDDIYTAIAAASILAKTHRDDFMTKLHSQYPEFDWINNKGYGTLKHREAILGYGLTCHHRRDFCRKIISGQGTEL
jgi:ribonuclease HII